ncbi:MAG: hypothetical protein RJA81_396, partial [Planctomycetota bacterium]
MTPLILHFLNRYRGVRETLSVSKHSFQEFSVISQKLAPFLRCFCLLLLAMVVLGPYAKAQQSHSQKNPNQSENAANSLVRETETTEVNSSSSKSDQNASGATQVAGLAAESSKEAPPVPLTDRLRSLLGVVLILTCCYVFSTDRRRISL